MKQGLLTIACWMLLLQGFAQLPPAGESRDYYFQKSDALRSQAWIRLGAGVGMMIIGGYFLRQASMDEDYYDSDKVTIPFILLLSGFPVALTSVPTFVQASKYEHRGEMMLGIQLQPPPPGAPSFVKRMPAVGITFQW